MYGGQGEISRMPSVAHVEVAEGASLTGRKLHRGEEVTSGVQILSNEASLLASVGVPAGNRWDLQIV